MSEFVTCSLLHSDSSLLLWFIIHFQTIYLQFNSFSKLGKQSKDSEIIPYR